MAKNTNNKSKLSLSSHRLRFLPEQPDFLLLVPSTPGIYIFEDEKQKPLYIGKSINLRSRIKQHLEGLRLNSTKAASFIPQTHFLYYKTVVSDIEAVIIEANYIKSFLPRYNSVIKDNRSNLYIIVTNPPQPRIIKTRATDIRLLELDNYQKQVFGPYTSSNSATTILKQVRRIFGYCLAPFNSHLRACFNRHLGHCPGACDGSVTSAQY